MACKRLGSVQNLWKQGWHWIKASTRSQHPNKAYKQLCQNSNYAEANNQSLEPSLLGPKMFGFLENVGVYLNLNLSLNLMAGVFIFAFPIKKQKLTIFPESGQIFKKIGKL